MSKNAYAVRLKARKHAEQVAILHYTGQRFLDIMTVALHEEYGFGRERLSRLAAAFNRVTDEYADALEDDADYAATKLARRVAQIMGERNAP